ncbi:MAG: histidine kinase [Halodesulfurarchaeum sp.]
MSLREFIPESPPAERSLVLLNGAAPAPVRAMLGDLFADQPVSFETADLPERGGDSVLLVEEGEVIATSPLSAVQDAILLVNSDLFITGTRSLEEIEVPDVIAGLVDSPFSLRGYPESNAEKLLLILVSRFVERRASVTGSGTIRTSFQRLSRLEDEQGTRTVYEKLAKSDVDVHVYGQPDWIPSRELDVITHTGRDENFERAWFVLFEPDSTSSRAGAGAEIPVADEPEPIGLLAYETEPREWAGFYTTDPERVGAVAEHIARVM